MVHANCQICVKKVFFSKADFAKAHGRQELPPSVWALKATKRGSKQSPTISYKWVCKVCKEEKHKKNCKYYW